MEIETGYIYCISNLDIMPGIYKVGVTMRSPLDRLKEANSSDTWKIPSYKIEFAKKVTNPKDKERTLHHADSLNYGIFFRFRSYVYKYLLTFANQ